MKKFLLLFLSLVMVFSLGACNVKEGHEEGTALEVLEDTTYYNGYLGFNFTLPAGYFIYEIQNQNFTKTPEETSDFDSLLVSADEDYEYMAVISFANMESSESDDHIGYDIAAERVQNITDIEGYVDYFQDYFLISEDDAAYTLVSEDEVTISGTQFVKCVIRVNVMTEEGYIYFISAYTCEVNDGFFLTIMSNYWPELESADDSAEALIASNLVLE